MLAFPLLASFVLAAGHPIPPGAWLDAERSFGDLTAFRVRVEVHGHRQDAEALGELARSQMEESLGRSGIKVVAPRTDGTFNVDATGDLVLDVHVIDVADQSAIAWDLHASQVVQLWTGAWTFASTWEVGDLLWAGPGATEKRLHDSLQLALDDFCTAYHATRDARLKQRAPKPPSPRPGNHTEL